MNERHENVTLVTRHNDGTLLEIVIFAGYLYYITHPDAAQKLKDRIRPYWQGFLHRVSVWQTREAIYSLPETEVDE